MEYFSNKPAPSLGHLLPRPGANAAVIKEPDLRPGLKRKLQDSEPGTEPTLISTLKKCFSIILFSLKEDTMRKRCVT